MANRGETTWEAGGIMTETGIRSSGSVACAASSTKSAAQCKETGEIS